MLEDGQHLKGFIINKSIEQVNGIQYEVNDLNLDEYGLAIVATNPTVSNGEFRRARAMLPFEYLDKKTRDFNWSLYSKDVEQQKRLANAFLVNFQKFKETGKGLYIYSKKKGSGKTLLACCLANGLADREPISVKFISAPDFVELSKRSGNNDDLESIYNAGVLVLDDIGSETMKDWINTFFFRLIDHRYKNKLITIYTSNKPFDDLDLDERSIDRIYSTSIPLYLPEEAIRAKLASQDNQKFLSELLSCNQKDMDNEK